jgi:hypothetical protein
MFKPFIIMKCSQVKAVYILISFIDSLSMKPLYWRGWFFVLCLWSTGIHNLGLLKLFHKEKAYLSTNRICMIYFTGYSQLSLSRHRFSRYIVISMKFWKSQFSSFFIYIGNICYLDIFISIFLVSRCTIISAPTVIFYGGRSLPKFQSCKMFLLKTTFENANMYV